MILISNVTAETLVLQGTPVELSHPIRAGGIDTTIVANLTVKNPTQDIIGIGLMVFNPQSLEYNITLNTGNSSTIGTYPYCITATNSTSSNTECFSYEVTLTGTQASTSQSITFFLLGIISLVFFGLALFGAIKIPFKHSRNERGYVVGMNDLKYVKVLLWFVSYIMMIFMTFAFRHVSYIANWDTGGLFLNAMFWFLIVFLFPVFVLTFTFGLINFFQDKKIKRMLELNIRVR